MNPMIGKMAMVAGAVLMSGALAMAQQPMGGAAAQQQAPANNPNNPNSPNSMSSTDQMQQNPQGNAMQDKDFTHSALEGGMAEVQLGQLAEQKASSDDVKQFGQKMVQDHTQLGDQLKPVAQQIGVNPPTHLSKKDQQLVAKLNMLSGPQFDQAYIQAMVKDHKKDLSDFRAEASNTQNPQLKQVAQQGEQVIDQHLQMIEQIAKAHNETASR
jgi:putative membrane protein